MPKVTWTMNMTRLHEKHGLAETDSKEQRERHRRSFQAVDAAYHARCEFLYSLLNGSTRATLETRATELMNDPRKKNYGFNDPLLSIAPLGFIAHFTWIVIQIVFFLILSFMRRPFKNTRWSSFLFSIYSIWRCNQVVHSDEIRSKAFTCLFASECGWWKFCEELCITFLPSLHKNWCWWDVFILPWAIYMMNVL